MTRTTIATAVLLCLMTTAESHAADETVALLQAHRVDHTVGISWTAAKTVRYDTDRNGEGTLDSTTFVATGGVTLLIRDFHPLLMEVTADEKKEDEPTLKGSTDFIEAVLATVKPIVPVPTDTNLRKWPAPAVGASDCERVQSKIRAAESAVGQLNDLAFDDGTRAKWAHDATGASNVAKVEGEVELRVRTLQTNLDAIEEANKAIRGAPDDCEFEAKTQHAVALLASSAQLLADRSKQLTNLRTLSKSLAKWAEPQRWSRKDPTAYVLITPEVTRDKKDTVTIVLTPRSLDATGQLAADEAGVVTRTAVFRFYRHFVSEFGVAAVYNDLRYPKYKVTEQDGTSVVVSDGTDSSNVNAAVTLNLICDCLGNDTVYPGFQLGVSKAENYPGLLAGGVLRFSGTKRFSLAVGRMVTWYKDLDKLQLGSPASENDLKADLSLRRSPSAWYLAVQYTF